MCEKWTHEQAFLMIKASSKIIEEEKRANEGNQDENTETEGTTFVGGIESKIVTRGADGNIASSRLHDYISRKQT